MDIASCIVDSSINTCEITILLHNRYKYVISIEPTKKYILLQFKTLEYKVKREDKDTYEDILDYLLQSIDDDAKTILNWDIEWINYLPDNDINSHKNTLELKRFDESIFKIQFKRDELKPICKMHLKYLRLIA